MRHTNGNVNEVTKLMGSGADINLRTGTAGVTPLMVAAQNGHLSVVKVLIAPALIHVDAKQ